MVPGHHKGSGVGHASGLQDPQIWGGHGGLELERRRRRRKRDGMSDPHSNFQGDLAGPYVAHEVDPHGGE